MVVRLQPHRAYHLMEKDRQIKGLPEDRYYGEE
jgi:hypothetical protein